MAGKKPAISVGATTSLEVSTDQDRERSTISFPYGDLKDAIEVAEAIRVNAGMSCETDQLAAFMNQAITSGAFRLKVATARIFGLIETSRGSVALTENGLRILDKTTERKSKVDAFLQVPLYRAIYDKYKGHTLPPSAALERELGKLGVSQKQTGKARQALERSADQAGFSAHGKDKLVAPVYGQAAVRETAEAVDGAEAKLSEVPRRSVGNGGGNDGGYPPFIQGLLSKLPRSEGEKWAIADRAKWLQTACNVFDLMYEPGDQDSISTISIKVDQL